MYRVFRPLPYRVTGPAWLPTAPAAGTAHTRNIGDTASITDALVKTATHPLADTASITDATARAVAHPLTDAGTIADAQTKAVTHPIADGAQISDSINTGGSVSHTRNIGDTAGITDSLAKAAAHPVADTANVTDARAKAITRPLADTAGITDNLTRAWVARLALADTLSIFDQLGEPAPAEINVAYAERAHVTFIETNHAEHREPRTVRYREHA